MGSKLDREELRQIGLNFAIEREKRGYTQRYVADQLGVNRAMWNEFESGLKGLNLITLNKLVAFFGVDTVVRCMGWRKDNDGD